jgi:hypothetical protein
LRSQLSPFSNHDMIRSATFTAVERCEADFNELLFVSIMTLTEISVDCDRS